ncbi:MAG: PGF-pre-PGF domain-containing protein [Candidatus Methanoperedens sp.]|nr:PGF-pre-PGF domain-containing protein [Candidatus Methanoperedens sp.]
MSEIIGTKGASIMVKKSELLAYLLATLLFLGMMAGTVSATAPVMVSAVYKDIDHDGTVDRVDVRYDQDIQTSFFNDGDWSFPVNPHDLLVNSGAFSTNDVQITVTGGPALTTSLIATTVNYTNISGIIKNTGSESAASGDIAINDSAAPIVINVSSSKANGTYTTGDIVSITVNYTEAVNVTGGSPYLTLNTGGVANYTGGNGTPSLIFTYIVRAGQNTADLDYASTGSLILNGSLIRDAALNAAVNTLAAPGAANSLGAKRDIVIDTTPVTFVTSFPIRMLNATGASTRIATTMYYYYNSSTIRINVSLNQTGLNVSGDFSPLNTSLINISTSYNNATGEYIYTLTATAGNLGMSAYPINITATNTTTGASNFTMIPPIVVMNINPQAADLTLGGTNWTTGIADFTNATFTFEKYNDSSHNYKLGKLEFLSPMNLADITTATALQNLGASLNMSATSMNLNSSEDALASMNVSSNLSFYNLTTYFSGKRASILINGIPSIRSDGVRVGDGTINNATMTWSPDNNTVNFTIQHWSNISLVSYGANVTVDQETRTTNATVNATYTLILHNNGATPDTFNLTVANSGASTAALNVSGDITLASLATRTLLLNVTNTSSGIFYVNVTARSNNDSTKFGYVNTTTTIPIVITITSPANASANTTGYVNVTATLDNTGLAQYLNWNGVNYTMTPNTSASAGTVFFRNMTGLLSGNYSLKVYANDTAGVWNVSGTRIVTVNRTTVDTTIVTIINNSTFITNETLEIAAPSGNVTIIIPNGTNASVGGAALTSISVDSLAQVNSTFTANLGSSDRLIGENLSLGPEGARFSPDIQIRFNYTDAQLTAAGITDESTLRIKFYNTTTNTWVEQTPYSLNITGNYIIANVSHFSTFALIGTITTTTTTSTGGGGSGGTGGGSSGVSTSEPFDNIAKSERYDKSLIANTPVIYAFKAPELGIYEIAITGKESENEVALRVEVLKGTSKLVTIQAPGLVYKNVNVWAGTKRLKEAVIRFKVENSWLGSNKLAESDIKMVKWDGSKWVQIETTEKNKDDTYTYYEAKTDTLSVFAITGMKGEEVVPTATEAAEVISTPSGQETITPATPEDTETASGFEIVLSGAVLCAVYLFGRKRR